MEFLFAIVAIVILTVIAGCIMDKLIPTDSEGFFREQHVFFAGFNTVVAVAVSSWFSEPILPVLALTVGTFGTWCLYRLCYRRPDQMILWDHIDMRFLYLALFVGIVAAVVTASLIAAPLLSVLWAVCILVLAWLCLFPL